MTGRMFDYRDGQNSRCLDTKQTKEITTMTNRQAQFDIARRGGKVEAIDGDRMVVSSGSTNHLLHFVMGLFTFGLWWVLVWFPICLAGGQKRRVVDARQYVRLPHELPGPEWMVFGTIAGMVILFLLNVPFIFIVFIVMGVAAVIRSIANSR